MYATVRRYEGIDTTRAEEIAGKVADTLVPALGSLPGFAGYYLIDAGAGTLASVSLFGSAGEAHASTRLAAQWVREQQLEAALPTTPKITAGPVIAHGSPAAAGSVVGVVAEPV